MVTGHTHWSHLFIKYVIHVFEYIALLATPTDYTVGQWVRASVGGRCGIHSNVEITFVVAGGSSRLI